jgi:hypothetical protein
MSSITEHSEFAFDAVSARRAIFEIGFGHLQFPEFGGLRFANPPYAG